MRGLVDMIKRNPEVALVAALGLWLAYTKLQKATTLRGIYDSDATYPPRPASPGATAEAIEQFTEAYATAHGY